MITVTLQQIKDARPCWNGWQKVLKANGGAKADFDKPFPLANILDSNGLDDVLWIISNIPEMAEHDGIWLEFSSWCALQNIEKIKKYCSNKDYDLIVYWLETNDPDIRESAKTAARSAAESAARSAWSAAEAAAEAAAEDAAWSARSAAEAARSAWSAARSAWSAARSAWSAARSAAESAQKNKLRELLEE